MAIIYGCSQSEKEILNNCPISVENYEDISITHHKLASTLDKEKKRFHENLPNKIAKEERYLDGVRNHKKLTIKMFDSEIEKIKKDITINKKRKKWFAVSINYPKKWMVEYISKPREIKRIEISEKQLEETLYNWKNNSEEIFIQENDELIYQIKRFDDVKKSPHYSGAYGEVEVLKKLSELDYKHHVLCGLNIQLDEWHKYNTEYLKSAQMDYIVVSNKGVFLIEVKNWGDKYLHKNNNLSPHEQLDRAGRVLYLFLRAVLGQDKSNQARIHKILLPTRSNISYNPKYKSVFVSNLNRVNYDITRWDDILNDSEVKNIVNILRNYVTC